MPFRGALPCEVLFPAVVVRSVGVAFFLTDAGDVALNGGVDEAHAVAVFVERFAAIGADEATADGSLLLAGHHVEEMHHASCIILRLVFTIHLAVAGLHPGIHGVHACGDDVGSGGVL